MLQQLRKLTGDNIILFSIYVFIILFAIFYPRAPLAGASFDARLGNIKGKVSLEAYETLDEGFEQKSLVLFYAPWCPHCKSIMPEWDRASQMNNTDVKMVKIDCDQNKDIAEKYDIQGFPTIKFLPLGLNNPKNTIDYQGDRKGEAFLAFIQNK